MNCLNNDILAYTILSFIDIRLKSTAYFLTHPVYFVNFSFVVYFVMSVLFCFQSFGKRFISLVAIAKCCVRTQSYQENYAIRSATAWL